MPNVLFFKNPQHEEILIRLKNEFDMGEHLLLIGNQVCFFYLFTKKKTIILFFIIISFIIKNQMKERTVSILGWDRKHYRPRG